MRICDLHFNTEEMENSSTVVRTTMLPLLGMTGKHMLIAEMRRRGDQTLEDSTAMLEIQQLVTFMPSCSSLNHAMGKRTVRVNVSIDNTEIYVFP